MKSKKRGKVDSGIKAVIYARFSSHSQTEQSIEGQLRDAYDYAKREGITVVGEYIDRAKTGRYDDRPAFQRMVKDAEKRQFQLIIVWRLDRFARNRYDSAIYKARLRKLGVRVVSVMENIGDNPEGIILEGLLESLAEYYSANLSVNIMRGQRENVLSGRHCGGRTPYGYKSVEGRLVPDERTAPIIQEVFSRYAQGQQKTEIVKWLSSIGARTNAGKPFTISSFNRTLSNTTYIGRLTRNGEEIEGAAEALITKDLFDKVQERVKQNARAPAASKAKVEYALQGKGFCGLCGSTLIGESGRGRHGGHYHYYACSARKRRRACTKANEKKDQLELYIVTQTVTYVLSPGMITKIADAVVAEYDREFSQSSVADLERLVARLDQDLRNLVETLTEAPKAARPMIYEKMEAIDAQKADAEVDLAKLRIASGIRYTRQEVTALLHQFCDGDPEDPAFRRRIIDTFINAVYAYDDRVIVFYNIRGGPQVPYESLTAALPYPTPDPDPDPDDPGPGGPDPTSKPDDPSPDGPDPTSKPDDPSPEDPGPNTPRRRSPSTGSDLKPLAPPIRGSLLHKGSRFFFDL
ncbi:MAG: recombinase family protein [Christensenellales bacterium]|jgi:site-specific DNA recombinase